MRTDDIGMRHKYQPKSILQTPAEYADPFRRYRRPISKKTKLGYLVAAALVAGAFWMWRS